MKFLGLTSTLLAISGAVMSSPVSMDKTLSKYSEVATAVLGDIQEANYDKGGWKRGTKHEDYDKGGWKRGTENEDYDKGGWKRGTEHEDYDKGGWKRGTENEDYDKGGWKRGDS